MDTFWNKAWLYWLLTAAAAIVAYFFVIPAGAQSAYYDVIGMAAGAAMFVGHLVHRAEPRPAWMLLAIGIIVFSAGDIVYGDYQPVPSAADMFYLSAYAILGVALFTLATTRIPRRGGSSLVDWGAVATPLVVASVVMVGRAYSHDTGAIGRAVAVAYPLMDLALLAVVVRLIRVDRGSRWSYVLLGAAFASLIVADIGYTLQDFGSAYSVGSVFDALWLMGYAFFGAAVLHPSLRRPLVEVEADGATERHEGPARVPPGVENSPPVGATR